MTLAGLGVIDVALYAPLAFCLGALVGFYASNRWRITRRNGASS